MLNDTIAAIATAPGSALRGIVRLSGPKALECVVAVFHDDDRTDLRSLEAPCVLDGFVDVPPPLGEIPCGVYLWPNERSYTRQPSAEFHTFGSPVILDAVLSRVCAAGARLAEPGEFTMRAFLAGRLDLTQAEAVLGVIDAASRKELDVALRQLAGGLAGPLTQLRSELLDLLAHLEAGLDFVDEDIEFITAEDLAAHLSRSQDRIAEIAQQMNCRGAVEAERRVALSGWPNVGKSSLFNALTSTNASIISPTPGATRDYVVGRVTWSDVSLTFTDTAGREIAEDASRIEHHAQRARADQTAGAHLELFCVDLSRPLNEQEREEIVHLPPHRLVVATKADLPPCWTPDSSMAVVSSQTGAGLEELRRRIVELLENEETASMVVAGTAVRCQESLRLAEQSIENALMAAKDSLGEELVAAELRVALDELGKVAGAVYTDDVLDRIFSRFCIGK